MVKNIFHHLSFITHGPEAESSSVLQARGSLPESGENIGRPKAGTAGRARPSWDPPRIATVPAAAPRQQGAALQRRQAAHRKGPWRLHLFAPQVFLPRQIGAHRVVRANRDSLLMRVTGLWCRTSLAPHHHAMIMLLLKLVHGLSERTSAHGSHLRANTYPSPLSPSR